MKDSMQASSPFKSQAQKVEERAAKRDAVLRAAVQMFNRRGFHATSLDDVAASLGITKRTIYHYLASKDQVLLECITVGLQQILDAAVEVQSHPGSGMDRLVAFLRRYAEINMDDFGRCVIRTGEETISAAGFPKYRALKRDIDTAMRRLIEEGIADGSIAPFDPKLMAFTIAGALNWAARWQDPEGPLNSSDIAARMIEILVGGMAPR